MWSTQCLHNKSLGCTEILTIFYDLRGLLAIFCKCEWQIYVKYINKCHIRRWNKYELQNNISQGKKLKH